LSIENSQNPAAPLVLLVDDEEDVRRLLATVLTHRGLRVMEAQNGREALDRIGEELPRLIILDLWMPVMDGASFMRELHAQLTSRPPVIMFTAHHDAPNLVRDLGVDVYVEKPVDLPRFIKLVEAMLRAAPALSRPAPWFEVGERREWLRRPHRRGVEVRMPGGRFFQPAFCIDISEEGMLLELGLPAQPGQYLAVAVVLSDGRRMELDARVRHIAPDGRAGVQFFALDATRRAGIASMLAEAV
jgi:CheY-like chemotaxis protein